MTKEMGSRMLNRKIYKILFASFIITSMIIIININRDNNNDQSLPETENLDFVLEEGKGNGDEDNIGENNSDKK